MKPAQRTKNAPRSSTDTSKPKRAETEHDWIIQELAEGKPLTRSIDPINDAVGRKIYVQNASLQEWRHPRTRAPFFVSRYYPHDPKIIIDKPVSEEEQKAKASFFAGTELTYVAIALGESLAPEDLRERVRVELIETAKRMKQRKKPAPEAAANAPATKTAKPAKAKKKAPAKASTKAAKA